MREFVFKPAPHGREQVWTIRDGHLMQRGGKAALKLADVRMAAWNDMTLRGTRNAWLDLTGPDGVVRVACSDHGGSRAEFLSLCGAVCVELAEVNPALAIRQGGGGAYRMAMFLIGLIAGLAGFVFLGAGLTGQVRQATGVAIGGGGAMAVVFLAIAWSFAPWRMVETLTPLEMQSLLADY